MKLQDKLDEMKKQSQASTPPETLSIMKNATQALLDSDILTGVVKVGDQMPGFSRPDENGETVNSVDLLRKGPLVVGFYRGIW